MSTPATVTRSLRSVQLRARIPRAVALLVVVILCMAGLRAIIAPPRPQIVTRAVATHTTDQGADAFAQAFARAYLSWKGDDAQAHQAAVARYMSSTLADADAVAPGRRSQTVQSTFVAGEQADSHQTLITVGTQTSHGLVYLSVPVARDSHGFMYVSGYPAIVGPPATDTDGSVSGGEPVSDSALRTVADRAITNYLAGNKTNLLADLAPNALVSMPTQHLKVTDTQPATWITPDRRVEVQVSATDKHGNSWTLAYQLSVQNRGRWYVQSIQVDPTFQGGNR